VGVKQSKGFFSEEKKQKTFISGGAERSGPWPRSWERQMKKGFLVRAGRAPPFFRKERLSS
jgi:hypothetical protein